MKENIYSCMRWTIGESTIIKHRRRNWYFRNWWTFIESATSYRNIRRRTWKWYLFKWWTCFKFIISNRNYRRTKLNFFFFFLMISIQRKLDFQFYLKKKEWILQLTMTILKIIFTSIIIIIWCYFIFESNLTYFIYLLF